LLSNENIICDSSSYGIQYVKFLEIIEGYVNVNWILILVTQKSTIGYGYVLTLDGGALSWKHVKELLFYHDILCKHKLFLFSMPSNNQIIIFQVSSKMSMKKGHMRMKGKLLET